jgi:hypothetical protein
MDEKKNVLCFALRDDPEFKTKISHLARVHQCNLAIEFRLLITSQIHTMGLIKGTVGVSKSLYCLLFSLNRVQ